MKVHMITGSSVLLELEGDETGSPEKLLPFVNGLLAARGYEPWPSAEAECFSVGDRSLAFFSPVRVFIPSVLSLLLEMGGAV